MFHRCEFNTLMCIFYIFKEGRIRRYWNVSQNSPNYTSTKAPVTDIIFMDNMYKL